MWNILLDLLRRLAERADDPLPPATPAPAGALAGRPLRYLIGASKIDWGSFGAADVVEVGYDVDAVPPAFRGRVIGYGNFWDEEQTGRFGPYLKPTDTAREYDEGVIDPNGPGWRKNLEAQLERRARAGIGIIELDNADPYPAAAVIAGYDLALAHGLSVIAKNPFICADGVAMMRHRAVVAAIMETDNEGMPADLDRMRIAAGKPQLPLWFVGFGGRRERDHTQKIASAAAAFKGIGVTFCEGSGRNEYANCKD